MSTFRDGPRTSASTPQAAEGFSSFEQRPSPGHREVDEVRVEKLNAYYGQLHILKDVTLGFRANQTTALIGPSGAGKSTPLRCINRLHEETPGARVTGHVTVDGSDVYAPGVDVTMVRGVVGMILQTPTPFPKMSIFDNGMSRHDSAEKNPWA